MKKKVAAQNTPPAGIYVELPLLGEPQAQAPQLWEPRNINTTRRKRMKTTEDPIPNELDNALSQLIPAVMACGDPQSPDYLDLAVFEALVETAPAWRDSAGGGGGRGRLSFRVAGQVEVAFRHCMHEAAMALIVRDDEDGEGGGGGRAMRTRGKKGKSSGSGGAFGSGGGGDLLSEMGAPVGILSLALDFVSNEVAASSANGGGNVQESLTRLPMVLVEDFLESQGREACTQFWCKWVEPNAARLTAAPLVLAGGKYTLIRLCKKLAQRMSKTHDSSFCGQIHLFLSKALTFFERSGLNVTGGLNLDNVTSFEDEEQFRRAMLGFDGEDEAGVVSASAGEVGAVATAGTGAAGGESGGGAMDVDTGAGGGGKGEGDDAGEFAVDYRLYQAFWRLQKYALKQDAAVKGAEAKDTWNAILADVDKILDAFEANAFSDHDLRLARERWMGGGGSGGSGGPAANGSISGSKRRRVSDGMELEANGAAAGEGGGYFGLKYLTSSRLLRLQLRDPTLRLQVLTQWLILAASLKSKVGKDKDSPNSAADLNLRMERAKKLVKATPPRGEEYLNMLQMVLNRESAWTQWKDVDKCKDIPSVPVGEAKSAAAAAAAGIVAAAPSYPNKRPRPQASVALAERAKHAPLGADFPLEKMVSRLHAGVPNSTDYLEDQRMCAEDPDIPSSELPSAGPLYTWRALRLLGKENPANLAGCYDGDLVGAMYRLDKAKNAEDAAAAAVATAAAAASESVAAAAAEKTTGGKPHPPSVVSTEGQIDDADVVVAMAVEDEGEAGEWGEDGEDGKGGGDGEDEEEGEDGEEGEVELQVAPEGAEGSGDEGADGSKVNGSAAGEGSDDGGEGDKKATVAAGGTSLSSPRPTAAAAAAAAGSGSNKSNPGNVTVDVPDSAATGLREVVADAAGVSTGTDQPLATAEEGSGRRKVGKNAEESPSAAAAAVAAATTAKAAASPRSPRLTRRRSKIEGNGSGDKN